MVDTEISAKILGQVSEQRLLDLERDLIRIPSSAFEEGEIADHLANYMSDIGLDVEMMQVENPRQAGSFSRQPIGRLRGSGGGPSLMLNGHMDPGVEMPGWSVDPYGAKYEDGWIWGMGAHDDKGGIAAMVTAVEAVIAAGAPLRGDVLVCPVVAHKYGGAGTRALVAAGVGADFCINLEHSANTIANVCVGIVMARIRTTTPDLFFRYSDEAKAGYFNAIEQQAEIMRRLGPSLNPIPAGGWLNFTPHPDLPGFPMHCLDSMHKEHYYHTNYTGLSTRECDLLFQIRTVPGQSLEGVRADLIRLLDGIEADRPAFNYDLAIPAPGTETGWFQEPMEVPKDHAAVASLAEGHLLASGAAPHIGGIGRPRQCRRRQHHGGGGRAEPAIRSRRHPHLRRMADPDERVQLTDLVVAAKAIAHATWAYCG